MPSKKAYRRAYTELASLVEDLRAARTAEVVAISRARVKAERKEAKKRKEEYVPGTSPTIVRDWGDFNFSLDHQWPTFGPSTHRLLREFRRVQERLGKKRVGPSE